MTAEAQREGDLAGGVSDAIPLEEESTASTASVEPLASDAREESSAFRWLGLIAYACYAAHAAYFLSEGRPANLLWGCHLAALGVGTGLLLKAPTFNGMGMLSLIWGVPLWLLDVFTGGEFLPTSMGTHVGGFVLGLYGIYKLGLPRWTWLKLWFTTVLLLALSRWACAYSGTEFENVNMCFGPPKGWEETFPPYPLFGALTLGGAALIFGGGEVVFRRLFRLRLRD